MVGLDLGHTGQHCPVESAPRHRDAHDQLGPLVSGQRHRGNAVHRALVVRGKPDRSVFGQVRSRRGDGGASGCSSGPRGWSAVNARVSTRATGGSRAGFVARRGTTAYADATTALTASVVATMMTARRGPRPREAEWRPRSRRPSFRRRFPCSSARCFAMSVPLAGRNVPAPARDVPSPTSRDRG